MQGDMHAPGTFVSTKENLVRRELGKNIWVYIDDIFAFSDTFEEHVKDVTNACSKLQNSSYHPNPRQSVVFATKLNIPRHMIEDDGIHLAPGKICTIMDWTRSDSQKELQRFNAMVNYISQCIPHIASITASLTELSGNTEWLCTDLQEEAFEGVKRAADKHKVLRPIDYNKLDMLWLFTDVSRTGTGTWTGQVPIRDAARPPAFHSRKPTPSQSNYKPTQVVKGHLRKIHPHATPTRTSPTYTTCRLMRTQESDGKPQKPSVSQLLKSMLKGKITAKSPEKPLSQNLRPRGS